MEPLEQLELSQPVLPHLEFPQQGQQELEAQMVSKQDPRWTRT